MTGAIDISLRLIITYSKVMALLLLASSVYIDVAQNTGGENLRFNTPFIAGLIGVKQWADYWKTKLKDGK